MNVFELFASITLNSKGYKDALQQAQGETQQAGGKISSSFSKVSDKVQKALSTMAKVGASAIAVTEAGIIKLAKSSLNAYAQYEQLVGGVDKLFGESASKVKAYAETAYTEAGLSANEYMETVTGFSASLIQSLGQDTSKSADYANRAIKDMSDNANTFGTDISSIQYAYQGFAKSNFTMLDNLRLGYGGTKEEMQRLIKDSAKMTDIQEQLGVTIDENSLSFATCVDAISVMQVAMGIAGTTSKEASKTIEGSINSMKASFKNLIAGIGNSEADLDGLFNKFTDSVKVAFNNILPVVKTSLEKIPKLINGLVDVVGDNFDEVFGTAIDSALEIVLKLGKELPKIFTKIFNTLPNILNKLVAKLGLDIDFNKLFDGLKEAGKGIEKTLQPIFKILQDGFKTALKVIEPVGEALVKLGQNQKLLELIRNLVIEFVALKVVNGIVSPIIDLFGKLRAVIDAVRVAETGYNAALAITEGLFNTTPFGLITTALATIGTLIFTATSNTGKYNDAIDTETGKHKDLTKAIDDERKAREDSRDAQTDFLNKQKEYTQAVDNTKKAYEELAKKESETGQNAKTIYDSVETKRVSYSDLTDTQKDLYNAYLDTQIAEDNQATSLDNLNTARDTAKQKQKEEILQQLETQRVTSQSTDNYKDYGIAITEAVENGSISSTEAQKIIQGALKGVDEQGRKTLLENVPSYIANGASQSFSDIGTDSDTMQSKLGGNFKMIGSDADTYFSKVESKINNSLDRSNYEAQGNSLLGFFSDLWSKISGFFSKIGSAISSAWSWATGGGGNTTPNEASNLASNITSLSSGYGFSATGRTSAKNGITTGMNGSIIKNTTNTNLHKGGIVINIDGAGKNAEEIAKKVSYELEKNLRKGRAVWA